VAKNKKNRKAKKAAKRNKNTPDLATSLVKSPSDRRRRTSTPQI
jgi:hypothetical protein